MPGQPAQGMFKRRKIVDYRYQYDRTRKTRGLTTSTATERWYSVELECGHTTSHEGSPRVGRRVRCYDCGADKAVAQKRCPQCKTGWLYVSGRARTRYITCTHRCGYRADFVEKDWQNNA